MALIKCPDCGKEISDKAVVCINCGCPINKFEEKKNTNHKTEKKSNRKKLGIIFGLILVLSVGLVLCVIGNSNGNVIQNSQESINPYLEYLPSKTNDDGKIELPSEIIKNKENVYFLGKEGKISYHKGKYGEITKMMWSSHDYFTHEEDLEMVELLTEYFDSSPIVESEQYGQYNDTTYYWIDENVPCTVVLYSSIRANHEDETDRIEIYWDMEKDIPKK